MERIEFTEIKKRLDTMVLPQVDLVVGIARGGLVPAALVANKLNCHLRYIGLNYRNDDNTPRYAEPQLIEPIGEMLPEQIILLVDDVSVSGKTMEKAKQLFLQNRVFTFVMKGKADYVVFPEKKDCVWWPWRLS